MKLVTFILKEEKRLGLWQDGRIIVISQAARLMGLGAEKPSSPAAAGAGYSPGVPPDCLESMEALLAAGEAGRHLVERIAASPPQEAAVPAEEVQLAAPLTRPPKIICIGMNYRSHCAEQGARLPSHPIIFAKFATAVTGPGSPVIRPRLTQQLDYETELAVVIGRRGKNIGQNKAMEYVAGYTIFNDVSARDIQFGDRQWVRGKTFDTFAPMGPWLVTADEIPDPQDLRLRCWVNGELRQDSTTAEMIFTVPYLIEFLSRVVTLEPGDIIATGTPAGVGAFRQPPVYLEAGDRIRMEITGLGVLENYIVDAEYDN
ncbi:MAG: FAA hydrolase family protein [Clostridia bacterium]|nr:MAG: FAA hydrolase family protein [Clostridia bacterium]